jgi:hypothetical protein
LFDTIGKGIKETEKHPSLALENSVRMLSESSLPKGKEICMSTQSVSHLVVPHNGPDEVGSFITETLARYFADGRRLIDLLWPVAPILRAMDPALGAILSRHCEAGLRLVQEYEVGAATPEDLRQAMTTFNHLVDHLEAHISAMFDGLFEYADALIVAMAPVDPMRADLTANQIGAVRASLEHPPSQTIEQIYSMYLRLDAILGTVEHALRFIDDTQDSVQPITGEVAMSVAGEVLS